MSSKVQFSRTYRYYALGLLLLGYIVNFVDRSILAILLEPIKAELILSDTELGMLGGLAFALFYATLGIPIAALADRTSRVRILAISMIIWSAMTAACGAAWNFVTLLLARIGVGVGEAGASPPSHSLISDYFPLEGRATALSIYALGIPIGSMVGNLVGGWGADELGWRNTFYLVGFPGIVIALFIWATLREPPRGMSDVGIDHSKDDTPAPSIKETFTFLWKKRAFKHIALAAGLHAFVSYGAATWNPPFMSRVHEMSNTDIGYWLAIVAGTGAIGTFFGGYLADKFSDKTGDRRWYFWLPGISTLLMVPIQIYTYLYASVTGVIVSLIILASLGSIYLGPSFAMTQALVTIRMRAVASAILLFTLNIIGMGLGPFLVGVFSDLIEPLVNSNAVSLQYALCIAVFGNLWATIHYFVGARHAESDLKDTEEFNAALNSNDESSATATK